MAPCPFATYTPSMYSPTAGSNTIAERFTVWPRMVTSSADTDCGELTMRTLGTSRPRSSSSSARSSRSCSPERTLMASGASSNLSSRRRA